MIEFPYDSSSLNFYRNFSFFLGTIPNSFYEYYKTHSTLIVSASTPRITINGVVPIFTLWGGRLKVELEASLSISQLFFYIFRSRGTKYFARDAL